VSISRHFFCIAGQHFQLISSKAAETSHFETKPCSLCITSIILALNGSYGYWYGDVLFCAALTIPQHFKTIQEELKVPYELKIYERGPDQRAPPELLAINPLGKSPVITDDNITLAESGAIVGEHLNKVIYDLNSMLFVRISHHETWQ
jgi:hypothetical protein